jgi:hypothetical protein
VSAVSPDAHRGTRSTEIIVSAPPDQVLTVESAPTPSLIRSEGVDHTRTPQLSPSGAVEEEENENEREKEAELGIGPDRPLLTLGAPRGGWRGKGKSSGRGEGEAERGGGKGGEREHIDDLISSSGVTATRKVTPKGTAAAKDFLEEHSAFLYRCGVFYSACMSVLISMQLTSILYFNFCLCI